MKVLIHFREKRVQELFELLDEISNKERSEPGIQQARFIHFLNQCKTYFRETDSAVASSELRSIEANFNIMLAGTDPISMCKFEKGRRKGQKAIFRHTLRTCEVVLQQEYQDIQQKLSEAEEIIGQVLLAAIQQRLISTASYSNECSAQLAEESLTAINTNEQLRLLNQKVALKLSKIDILMLYERLLRRLSVFASDSSTSFDIISKN